MLFPRSPPSLWVSPGKNQGFLAAQLCPVQALGELTWMNESMDVFFFFFFFNIFGFFGLKACGILAAWPGMEPAFPTVESEALTAELPGKSWIWGSW